MCPLFSVSFSLFWHFIADFMEKNSISLFLTITSVETHWSNLPWLSFVVKGMIYLGYIWRVNETRKPPVSKPYILLPRAPTLSGLSLAVWSTASDVSVGFDT